MAKVEGLNKIVEALKNRAAAARKDDGASVVVGYTANYAIYVHENLEMSWQGQPRRGGRGFYWDPQGQARSQFLIHPFRTQADELRRIVVTALLKGATMAKSLLLAGLRLQRESQRLVPVDTGNLRASAFTRLEP